MRKKIKQLAYGIFDYAGAGLSFSTECIELEIAEGKDAAGEFIIHSEKKIRGIVYSTHTRMECLTPQFEGREIVIRYQFHSEGLVDGDIRKGEFVIVCDQGEYNLSFVVSVCKSYAKTSIGKIKTMSDFVRLARESYVEAYQVFYSKSFKNILEDAETEEGLFYKAIRKETPSQQAVEAYLVGIGKKPPVRISLEEKTCDFYGVSTSSKEQLHLTKNHWGYFKGTVKTDAAFIRLSKEEITPEDFLGSTYFYGYYIEAEALHAGKNYGRIVFEFPNDNLVCELCISMTAEEREAEVTDHHRELKYKTELMQCYVDYRTKKIVTGVWAKKSIELLNKLADREPENELYRLMKAQAFLVNRQRQEASWILEEYKRACEDKHTPEWGYYLYLCTLMEREESYVNRLMAQIEELFQEYSDSSLLFWVLLFMREEYYRSNTRRLKAVEEWITRGCDSPYFYVEAYYLYCQDPYLLSKLGTFEIKILNWATKQQVISKEVANQIISLIPTTKVYDEKIVRILEACYDVAEKEEAAAAICSYLIKGQRFEKKYHKWYMEGIKHEIRITNLYEAYLISADKESIKQVPKEIFMYFQYHNALSYKHLALLYAYIIQKKETYKKVYQNYRRTIEQFAISQIEAGHMDENLAVIYQEVLQKEIWNCELAEKFANVMFVRKLSITGEKTFYKVIVVQKQWKQRQIVPIVDGTAYFSVFSEDYVILLQDAKGQLFTEKSFYIEEHLLDAGACLERVEKLAPMAVPCLIYSFNEKYKKNAFLETDIERFSVLMDSEEIRTAWKGILCPSFMRYLRTKDCEDNLTSCMKNVDYSQMSAQDRCFMIEQLIEKHQFEMAYDLLYVYGSDVIGADYRMSICSYKITACDYEEDEFLLGMASEVFSLDKYNDVIVSYLCRYYNGPTKRMVAIWKAAFAFRADTFDMEERIITQTLYSTEYVEDINVIYEAYCEKGGNDLIFMAYLSYYSHLYLVKDVVVPSEIFLQMENRMVLRKEMTDVQKFTLLKFYAEKGQLTESQYKTADALLLEGTCKNMYFAYYKKLDRNLQIKYHLHDKYFVEYHSKPGANISISYYINENNLKEEALEEVYPGIFVKSFLLFAGDKVSYYIAEQDIEKGRNVTLSGQLECDTIGVGEEQGRYTMLNQIRTQINKAEINKAKQMMKEYAHRQIAAEDIFRLL